ncbi:MAG: hypothetical protein F6K42_04195 [Leptolyngbya sp. SIO1D8]|nr:hypothetical protein [Leptolyngbya sp. SIO1D8]
MMLDHKRCKSFQCIYEGVNGHLNRGLGHAEISTLKALTDAVLKTKIGYSKPDNTRASDGVQIAAEVESHL